MDIEIGAYVVEQFLRLAYERGFEVLAYCVMTDHFHVLVEGHQDDAALKKLMHRWKQATGYWWRQQGHKDSLWQEGSACRTNQRPSRLPAGRKWNL